MDDFLRDAGLKYAQNLPASLVGLAVALVLIGWAFWKVYEATSLDLGEWRTPALWILAIAALVCLVQVPTAYVQASSYCKDQFERAGGAEFSGDVNQPFYPSSCSSIWPNGP